MKRYYFVSYTCVDETGRVNNGNCNLNCTPGLNLKKASVEIIRMCKDQGKTVKDIVINNFIEMSENDYNLLLI